VKITISLGQKWPQTPYLVGAVIYFHVFPSISIEFTWWVVWNITTPLG
jgi:hypothetical protein